MSANESVQEFSVKDGNATTTVSMPTHDEERGKSRSL